MTDDEFWHVSFSLKGRKCVQDSATSEHEARTQAHVYSEIYGSATVTNRSGLITTYVDGVEHQPPKEDSIRGEDVTSIETHADRISARIKVDRSTIETNEHGVILTPDQLDTLTTRLIIQGWKNASTALKEAAERAYDKNDRDRWAILVAGAAFLDSQIDLSEGLIGTYSN